uniref:Caspase-8 n=2 Tax=Tetraodon nigroviridis TaxID=99883 RepID=H3CR38_TETNG
MDLQLLSRICEQLDSQEVASLCFLCREAVSKKSLEGINDARGLFKKLADQCLLENNSFLRQLLQTIRREDLLRLLGADNRQLMETDASPLLSGYSVMLYNIYEDLCKEDLGKIKFFLGDKLGRRPTEMCKTVLDVFAEMEKKGFLSEIYLDELHSVLQNVNPLLASKVQQHMQHLRDNHRPVAALPSDPAQVRLPVRETQLRDVEQNLFSDAEPAVRPSRTANDTEYYSLTHKPHGLCVVFNNEFFPRTGLRERAGTIEDDADSLRAVFTKLGFTVVVHKDLTATDIERELQRLANRNFVNEDALVVCVLSHGQKGCFYGTDGATVKIQDVTQPFTSTRVPTLAGKPKLFFIQACQGDDLQMGCVPCPPRPAQNVDMEQSRLEEDAGFVRGETVPDGADFLLGMATVQDYKAFRNTTTGSIYIQELCSPVTKSAESSEQDDILSILTRVNREVSKGVFQWRKKQMPEPKYTLTKKLVLKLD